MREWWRGGVIYQIYPRSFRDGNADGIGDLPGILAGLDHIASLGVDAIWISPFFKSPMRDFGYDVEDYLTVDPMFGANEDFDKVLARSHELGLKVVIDLVLNHTADTHAWFRESRRNKTNPKADWYVWADPKPDGTPPNNWLSVFGGSAWQWEPRRRQFYFHQFLAEQPDLNVRNVEVRAALLDVLKYWLEKGVDGIRLDACSHYMHDPLLRDNPAVEEIDETRGDVAKGNPYGMQRHLHDKSQPENLDFIAEIRALVDRFPNRMVVAEVSCDKPVERAAEYIAGPTRLHTAYNFALLGGQFSAAKVRSTVEEFEAQPGDGWPSWAFSNHDVIRFRSRWGGPDASDDFVKSTITLLGCLRGTAFLYQGDELGLTEADVPRERMLDPYGIAFYPDFKGRDGCRTPIPWSATRPHAGFSTVEPPLPIPADHVARAIDAQDGRSDSVLSFTRAFLKERARHDALTIGTIVFHGAPEPFLVFERRSGDERLLLIFNLGTEAARLPLTDAAPRLVSLTGDAEAPSARVTAGVGIVFPPRGFAALELALDATIPVSLTAD